MLLHVLHETAYDYKSMVRTAQHMAHLKPATTAYQELLSHRLVVDPAPARLTESVDVYGNTRSFFSLQFTHDWLRVQAESLVSTSEPPEPEEGLSWEEAAERMRYRRGAVYDAASEFAFSSPYVPCDASFASYAQPVFTPGKPLVAAARELMRRIYTDFEYAPASTDVNTPALEALTLRKGVCQDLAHVMLGCLRSLGLPARYVSGYLLTHPAPGRPRLVGSDASHAWVSVYLPAEEGPGTWADLDPTNDRAPGEDYVTLAIGRDYSDVSPIRGVLHGGARHTLRVGVTVTPTETAAPEEVPAA
jgi:transglutaminase-like putative cysteine protease